MKLLMMVIVGSIMPWGKDAEIAYLPKEERRVEVKREVGDYLIEFHQKVISPSDGPRSNFEPTSSHYALQAMRKYGFFTGFLMGCDRLMRENKDPWVYRKAMKDNKLIKWDPP